MNGNRSPLSKLLLLIGLSLSILILIYLPLSYLCLSYGFKSIAYQKLLQGVGSLLIFLLPVILLTVYNRDGDDINMFRSILYNRLIWKYVLGGIMCMIFIIPFINWIGYLNSEIKFPDFMKDTEMYFRRMDEEVEIITKKMLMADNLWVFLFNVIIFCVIPAFVEEIFMRGFFQRILTEWFKNIIIANIIVSIIFSFIHFQIYSFLPRFFLSLLLGFIFYYTSDIRISIICHFFNNLMSVAVMYIGNYCSKIKYYFEDYNFNIVQGIISLVVVGMIYYYFIYKHRKLCCKTE